MITKDDIHDFTKGACFLLAEEIEKITGWPIAAFWDGFRPVDHVFNVLPDGRYLDVEGVWTRQKFLCNRSRNRLGITTKHVQLNEWELPWSNPDYYAARAQVLAPQLISDYLKEAVMCQSQT